MSNSFLTDDASWKSIVDYYNQNGSKINIYKLFQQDPYRFDKFR